MMLARKYEVTLMLLVFTQLKPQSSHNNTSLFFNAWRFGGGQAPYCFDFLDIVAIGGEKQLRWYLLHSNQVDCFETSKGQIVLNLD